MLSSYLNHPQCCNSIIKNTIFRKKKQGFTTNIADEINFVALNPDEYIHAGSQLRGSNYLV